MQIDWSVVGIIINVVLTCAAGVLGILVRAMTAQMKSFEISIEALRIADATMSRSIADVALLVAGKYVQREEFRDELRRLESKIR